MQKKNRGETQAFLAKYNPDYLLQRYKGARIEVIRESCVFANSPTLSELKASHGDNVPIAWLMPQLLTLSEFCGAREKMSDTMIERTAIIIYSHFYYLKVSELLLFFYEFASGRFGHFYGTTDPQTILNAIYTFVSEERNPMISRRIQEQREKKQIEDRKNAVSREEYIKMSQNYEKKSTMDYTP